MDSRAPSTTHDVPARAPSPRRVAQLAHDERRGTRVCRAQVERALERLVRGDLDVAVGRPRRRGERVVRGRVGERELDRPVRGRGCDVVWAVVRPWPGGEERDLSVDMSVGGVARRA